MPLSIRKPVAAEPARMAALSKLPVFLDLQAKRVIVAGGSVAAAWKAELLAAAGADVVIHAPYASEEMSALVARGAAAGSLRLLDTAWTAEVLSGAALAVADCADNAEAAAFLAAGNAAGVPVNVIDKPAFCQFQLGAIVNRSPVVVAISTDGGSPVLAQAIRRRIETLLPPSLAAWGSLAKRLRSILNERLAAGAMRRHVWERFAERAMTAADAPLDDIAAGRMIDEMATAASTQAGRVTLVGAGPGDAELLTLKAVRAMQSADVILYDDLVSDEVLELARREAKRMTVGKRGHRESCAQADINALMIKLALQGKRVVRLKSGDPMIFGRAGEEISGLERHGIPVEIVPGITSALAAAARLGVSLTHRDCAQSVRFVTGHARDGKLPADLDWCGLADPATTLVFYMGGRTGPLIAERLIAAGLPPSTPAVALSSVTRSGEWRWTGTLADLGRDAAITLASDPVLLGIGQVFAATRSTSRDVAPEPARALG